MKNRTQLPKSIWVIVLLLTLSHYGLACSMYKITYENKTVVGCNEDAWRVTPHIWFETSIGEGNYGAAFTGSRFDGNNGYAPQSGMNEVGLVFSRLAAHTPKNQSNQLKNRKEITNPIFYLKDILHTCKTVEEVAAYIGEFDHSFFKEDVFIYIDKSGKYLIVEPFSMSFGSNSAYVLSNYCPSETPHQKAYKMAKYRNGFEFLKNKIDTTLSFYERLSDTMHVCREKIGDGTLLTSIWDINNGTVNLYFYHSYNETVQFNLKEELEKGSHIIAIESLFPKNSEFEKLKNYQTPHNNPWIALCLFAFGCLFLFTSFFFLITSFRRKHRVKYSYVRLILIPFGLVLSFYLFLLWTNTSVVYFPAPYLDPTDPFITLASYLTFVLVGLIIPSVIMNVKLLKEKSWGKFSVCLFTLNNAVYLVLIGLFAYWDFITFSINRFS